MTTYLSGLPAPEATDVDRSFWEAAKRHELAVQVCAACESVQWPAEEICSRCHSFDLTWRPSSGRGKIFSWTRVWHPVHPALAERCPYLVVVVELDDFPEVIHIGNLLGDVDQDVRSGIAVEAAFEDHPEGHTLVQWRIAR